MTFESKQKRRNTQMHSGEHLEIYYTSKRKMKKKTQTKATLNEMNLKRIDYYLQFCRKL